MAMNADQQAVQAKLLNDPRHQGIEYFVADPNNKRRNNKDSNCWSRRTNLEKALALISIICGLAAIILSFTLIFENDDSEFCLTSGCIHASSLMLEQLDETVEPCDDFYNFACGKFIRESIIPDEKVAVSAFSVTGDKLQEQLRTLISEPVNANEIEPFKLVKKLYKACMNKTLIEDRGLEPLLAIQESFGGWPVIKGDKWNERNWSWQDSVKKFCKQGYSPDFIFDFSVGTDWRNSTRRIIDIDQASLGLSREYLVQKMNSTIVEAYYSYQVDMAVIFGADRAFAEKEMMKSLEFEFDLANISFPSEKRRNTTAMYNPISIKDLQTKFPYNQWLDYFNDIFPESVQVTENEILSVSHFDYFEDLGKLLRRTPKRTIANYVMWRMTAFSTHFMTEQLRKRQLQYSTARSGKQAQDTRWKECVDLASGSVPIASGALYVRKHFQQDSKATAMDMVGRIKIEFENILKNVPWMDETTRAAGLDKLKSMSTHIGYPDELMDDNKLVEYYQDADVDENKYLEAILKMKTFDFTKYFNKLREPVNKTDWENHAKPAIVNAYYSPIENSIQFPAGILQGQFFSADRPRYMNYGAIGFVIGHEITHGFDDQGRLFDGDGNLADWWQDDTENKYLEKSQCIIEQYGNYTEPNVNLPLNGINTQGENIADNGGIKEAYLAYKKWVDENKPEPKLPAMKYSSNQLFWISAAQTWCSIYRPESVKNRITTGVHSPGQFRVLGPLSNMDGFANDFSCPKGSPMNPIKKCEVW